ncbi:pyruvate kinase [Chryseobacterium sp. 2TAF14]|uniref:pyruvate kinase n=1 Tax=Chryseobacterium sp. 2TAF14 TaxID=3233007 RepID=UPI003F90C640
MNKYLKKTKIIATLGPASSSKEVMLGLMRAGVDVFRINFSHADYDLVRSNIQIIRDLNKEYGYSVSILGDLQGPKLRVGVVKEGSYLNPGDILTFTNEKIEGDSTKVYMTYQQFPQDVKVGERILIDDGKLVLEVLETNNVDTVKAKTIQGGPLSSKKGVNLPNTNVSLPALTEKDIQDANFMMDMEVDWIALSFVRHAQDIIEVPMEEVPAIQKNLVERARFYSKPVIIATQMMETMINSLTPTRAEVNDVANSVLDGADAVMLSGETSVGRYPVQVVENMAKIVKNIEMTNFYQHKNEPIEKDYNCIDERFITNRVCLAAVRIAKSTNVTAIVTLTSSGYTAFQLSAHRPNSHIIVFSGNKRVITMLNLLWGVRAYYYDMNKPTDETIIQVNMLTHNHGYIETGDFVININATPSYEGGKTNTLRLTTI